MVVVIILLILVIVLSLLYDWKIHNEANERQDEVNKRIEYFAKQVADSVRIIYDRQVTLDERSRTQNIFIDSQLQTMQKLINSDMMAARRDELIRTKELLAALERIVTLTTMSRQQPDVRYIEGIESATKRIKDLENILGIRTYGGNTTLG